MLFSELEMKICAVKTANIYLNNYRKSFNKDDLRLYKLLLDTYL